MDFWVAVFCMVIVEVVNGNVSVTLTFVTDAISRREIARRSALWARLGDGEKRELWRSVKRGNRRFGCVCFVNWVDYIDGRSSRLREISIWGAGIVFWFRRDLDILAFGRKTVRSGTLTCRSSLTKLTEPLGRKSIGCSKAALKRSGGCGGRETSLWRARETCRFWKVVSGSRRGDGGKDRRGASRYGYGRTHLGVCGSGEPKMSGNRLSGGEHGPRQRRPAF